MRVDGRVAEACIQLVEMAAAAFKIVGKQIRQRDHPRRSAVRKGSRHSRAAVAAAQQAQAHGGVCLVGEGCGRLDQQKSAGSCRSVL